MERSDHSDHVVVVGAGVAGLTAAHDLAGRARVTVLEGSPEVGGKLRGGEVAGRRVDVGAEAMLARRPEGLALLAELGLSGAIVHPGTTSASILSRGVLRPMPAGQIMGVPSDLGALARSSVLSAAGLARVPFDLVLPSTPWQDDVSVAAYVGGRMGVEVVDRLVEPLLGGVYAGRAEELSLEATLAGLASAARAHRSLIEAARSVAAATPKRSGPVFASLRGGLGSLPTALATALTRRGGVIRTGTMARELARTPTGWRLVVGPARAPEVIEADAVILAVPAGPAGRLLSGDVPAAAAELRRIEYASMAIVTLAYTSTAFPDLPPGSGYLIPAVEPGDVKAVTFSTSKWPSSAGDTVVVRCSIGRHGDEIALQRDDAELKAAALLEMARTCGVTELPVDSAVTRWGGALPQYSVGHLARVARIRAAVATEPGLAVCGAAYDGLGIPACVATAHTAATRIRDHLADRRESKHGSDGQAEGPRPQQRDPLHDVVGLPGGRPRPDRP